jgi:hypothetical protein
MRRTLTFLLTAIVVLAPAYPAIADRGQVTRLNLASPVNFAPSSDTPIVQTTLTMTANQSRHLSGRLEATSSTPNVVAMNATIKCFSGSTLVGVAATSSRNHEGNDTTSYATDGHLPLLADLLFTAPSSGSYQCGLYGKTAASSTPSYHLTAVAGGSTWLKVSQTDQVGAHWWQNRACNSTGSSSTCSYIGPGQPDTAFVFYETGAPHDQWTVGSQTTEAEALANITMTTCYRLTSSCDRVAEADRLPRAPGSHSVVNVQLQVLQMTADGSHTCNTTTTAMSSRTILDDAHHYTANLALPRVAVRTDCGRRFMLRVYVNHVSGSPVKIDGLQGAASLSNGIMMNL